MVCSSCEQIESEASDQQSEDTRRENVAKNDSHSDELSPEKACDCQIEIDELRKRIKDLEERREVELIGVRRFMASDSDIRFYTGLPDYATFMALYNFGKPKPGFRLNYYIPMLLKIRLILFREEGHGICVNSMTFFLH